MVRVVPLKVKSVASAGGTAVADTIILVSVLEGVSNVAVIRLTPPFSEIDDSDGVSVSGDGAMRTPESSWMSTDDKPANIPAGSVVS